MKLTIFILLVCSGVIWAKQCCPGNNGIISPNGRCGTERMTSLNCTAGRMLLKEVIVDGNKVSTQDAPTFIFVEDPNLYCLGTMYRNINDTSLGTIPVAVVCFDGNIKTGGIETSGILTLISVFFLIATIAVYMYFPQMRDLQGNCYICMCISMALGFLSLGMLQLNPEFMNKICSVTGFLIYTWMMATFFWMNVICINMYRTVVNASHMQKTERLQFLRYSCYAWGCTLVLLTATLIANFVEGDHIKPGIGSKSCWFRGRTETWAFFYGPIACLITLNIMLFGLSSYKLWRRARDYNSTKLDNLKYKFLLTLKLFLVMGISWIFEIASFAHGKAHLIWSIMDTINCLQGVIIFLLLVVFRKRVVKELIKESCCLNITKAWAEKLSPHDDTDDECILPDDTTEIRLN